MVDYETDTVTLDVTGGSGAIIYETTGTEEDARAATELWEALTEGQPVYDDASGPVLDVTDDDLLDLDQVA